MYRPRIKYGHRPVRLGDGWVRIGGIVPGVAADLPDPEGWVWALLELLGGTRTVDQVVADLVHRFPSRPADEIRSGIVELTQAGYVEDAAAPIPPGLSERERERYGRGQLLSRWMDRIPRRSGWDTQLLLRQARVTVVGIGGVGSAAALALVSSGVGWVHCVDPDVVEWSNLNRQILFVERDVGRLKVDAALERLRASNSDVTVTGEARRIEDPAGLAALAVECDVLLLAADQPAEIRSWANQACLGTGTAWVHGGYHGPLASMGLYRPGTGPCYECGYAAERAHHAGRLERTVSSAGPVSPAHAANAVTAGITGLLAAHAVMSLITQAPPVGANRQYGVNLVTLRDIYVLGPTAPVPDCPACGREADPGSSA
jgi:molybdopterin/thiamine biosynthesis adenylyltransferase